MSCGCGKAASGMREGTEDVEPTKPVSVELLEPHPASAAAATPIPSRRKFLRETAPG
jgi:hypothetical protein